MVLALLQLWCWHFCSCLASHHHFAFTFLDCCIKIPKLFVPISHLNHDLDLLPDVHGSRKSEVLRHINYTRDGGGQKSPDQRRIQNTVTNGALETCGLCANRCVVCYLSIYQQQEKELNAQKSANGVT